MEITGNDFHISTNKGRLTQVIDNLLLNAEYWLKRKSEQEPTFSPAIHLELGSSRMKIWDNGPGISESVEGSLFEPFVTLKPRNLGRGLGLFICAQIMESLGGSIVLLPDRNGEGKRYIFELDLSGVRRGEQEI